MKVARVLAVVMPLLWPAVTVAATTAPAVQLFPSERQAQQHCPADVVVWVNTQDGVYHFKGQRYYANTRAGAYACMREADKAGDHATRNGP